MIIDALIKRYKKLNGRYPAVALLSIPEDDSLILTMTDSLLFSFAYQSGAAIQSRRSLAYEESITDPSMVSHECMRQNDSNFYTGRPRNKCGVTLIYIKNKILNCVTCHSGLDPESQLSWIKTGVIVNSIIIETLNPVQGDKRSISGINVLKAVENTAFGNDGKHCHRERSEAIFTDYFVTSVPRNDSTIYKAKI